MSYQPDIETWISEATTQAIADGVIVVAEHGLEPHVSVFPDGSVAIRRERWGADVIHTDYELRGGTGSLAGTWARSDIASRDRAAGRELAALPARARNQKPAQALKPLPCVECQCCPEEAAGLCPQCDGLVCESCFTGHACAWCDPPEFGKPTGKPRALPYSRPCARKSNSKKTRKQTTTDERTRRR